jgi:hypothetical protein
VTHHVVRSIAACVLLAAAAGTAGAAQGRPQAGALRLVVKDPSGAVIPRAAVQIRGAEKSTEQVSLGGLTSDDQGVALIRDLVPGRYIVEVSFPGFETRVVPDLRIRTGETRREVTLDIQKVDETVSVGRDAQTAASDPRSDRFGNVLSKEQIDALPDDPDEMEQVLKQMAGPGATIRVDGFRGGRLPPKSQIRSIRFASGMFAAENHGGGMMLVDIGTAPGMGPLRGGMTVTFRDDSMNARNAFQQEKGPEQTQQYDVNMSGTLLKDKTSFSLSVGGASLYDSANIYAARPDGTTATAPLRRPSDRLNLNARVDQALTKTHQLRASYQQNANDQQNLGVGAFDLPERAYTRNSTDGLFRLSESGPFGRAWFGESRLQVRRVSTDSLSAVELPTVRVLDAFTAGGAQQRGGRRATELEWATNVDWARGKHAVRMGALVEGGWYRGDSRANYLGTFTFGSLEDYEAGRPTTFSRRSGNPLVEFTHWQAGLFIQDDWRVRKDLTLSAGLRQEMQTHLDDRLNLAPRAGLTWSPFKSGRTTVRVGGGVFYDWLDSETYEQTLRVDGERQEDRIVQNPGYPDPFSGGSSDVLPTSKYLLAPGLLMPRRVMANVGVSQQLSQVLNLNVNYMRSRASGRFRGRNINAPIDGERPDPAFGNVTQVESTARQHGDSVSVGLNMNIPARRTFVFANYSWLRQRNDADGPFSLPANSYDLAAEWGPALGIPTHTASALVNTTVLRYFRLGVSTMVRSGLPYNITTGHDDNGDTISNDRPGPVGRNSVRGKSMWDVGARLSYAFGFGERPQTGGPGGPGQVMIVQRVGGGAGAGDLLGAVGGGGAENKRIRFELFVSASNLLNHVNPTGYSGVMTSPFFLQPTAAMPGRKLDVGVRVGF